MAQELPPTIANRDEITIIDGAEELSQHTDLSVEQAIAVMESVDFRAKNRSSGHKDFILVIEDWMAGFWEDDYDQEIETPYMLARRVSDYSDKAFKLDGAYHILEDGLDVETPITSSVQVINHATPEYPKEDGETFVAKSGVIDVFAVR